MNNIQECLDNLMTLDGALGAALVDWTSGLVINAVDKDGSGLAGQIALGDAQVVMAKVAVMGSVEIIDPIEDIIVTFVDHYHVIRLLQACPTRFVHGVFDRSKANLAHVRSKFADIEDLLVFSEDDVVVRSRRDT